MRAATIFSVLAHVAALIVCLVFAGVRVFDTPPPQAIAVDIVTPQEAPPDPVKEPDYSFPQLSETESKPPEPPPPAPAPQPQPEQQASPPTPATPQPQPTAQQQAAAPVTSPEPPLAPPAPVAEQAQPEPPPPEQQPVPTAEPDITAKYGITFTMPDMQGDADFDSQATAVANVSLQDAAALRKHLRTCSILPRSVSATDNIRVVLRVALRRDGMLASEPLLIQATGSEKGPVLMRSAMQALQKCQPYTMLPADKYNEWRMLDLSFTPKDFTGG